MPLALVSRFTTMELHWFTTGKEKSSPRQLERACHSQPGHGALLLNILDLTEPHQTRSDCGWIKWKDKGTLSPCQTLAK